jgi:hypothetical protein
MNDLCWFTIKRNSSCYLIYSSSYHLIWQCRLGTQSVRILFSCLDIRSKSMFPTLPRQLQCRVLQWQYPIILSIEQKVSTRMHSIVIDHSGLVETISHEVLSTKAILANPGMQVLEHTACHNRITSAIHNIFTQCIKRCRYGSLIYCRGLTEMHCLIWPLIPRNCKEVLLR